MTTETRFIELRLDGSRRISGTIVSYNDTAEIGGAFKEQVRAGAFSYRDVILNMSHDNKRPLARLGGGLNITDGSDDMRMTADLPNTRDADDTLTLIKNGTLRGLSVEMEVRDDEWRDGGSVRVIKAAELTGIGIVSRPAYPQSSVDIRDAYLANKPQANQSGNHQACATRRRMIFL